MSSINTPRRRPSADEPAVRPSRRSPLPRLDKFPWRWLSFGLVMLIAIIWMIIFLHPAFYVSRVEIGGNKYIPPDEIFTESGIANIHILWVDPSVVKERIEQSPSVSSAEVYLYWPARVQILVQEREPALVWVQSGVAYWVDVNGNLMPLRQALPDLVEVINEGEIVPFGCPGPACPEGEESTVTIDPQVVSGSQQLKTLRPEISVLYYDPVHGLSYQDPRGWRAYFGEGVDMDIKLSVYEQMVTDLLSRAITPSVVDVSQPDSPYYQNR